MRKRILMPLVLILMGTLLAGCFEVEERVTLADTGAGTIRFLIRLPIAAEGKPSADADAKKAAEELSKDLKGFTDVSFTAGSKLGQTVVEVKATAPSMGALGAFYGPFMKPDKEKGKDDKAADALQMLTPKSFYAVKRKGDRLVISRTFTPPPQKKKKLTEDEKNMEAIMGMMGASFMRFELDVPGKVLSSNAEEVDGSRLVWVIPMEHFQKNRVTFTAEVELPPEAAKAMGK